jgi:hypothetical protein
MFVCVWFFVFKGKEKKTKQSCFFFTHLFMCSTFLTEKLPPGLLFNFHTMRYYRTFRASGIVLDPFSGTYHVYDTTSREASAEVPGGEHPSCSLAAVPTRMNFAQKTHKLTRAQASELETLLARGVRQGQFNLQRRSWDAGRSTLLAAWPECCLVIAQRGDFIVAPADSDQKELVAWFRQLFESQS